MALRKGFKYDKKTGRPVRKNAAKSRKMKIVARKRRGKHLKAGTKRKLKMAAVKRARTGRTKSNRRVVKVKGVSTSGSGTRKLGIRRRP